MESELRFASEFVRKGYNVYFPFSESDEVDIVIEKDNIFKKVQVKATKPIKNVLKVKLRSTNNWQNKKYHFDSLDYIAVYDYENKQGYLLSMSEFSNNSQVNLRLKSTLNNQEQNVNFAKDYFYFK